MCCRIVSLGYHFHLVSSLSNISNIMCLITEVMFLAQFDYKNKTVRKGILYHRPSKNPLHFGEDPMQRADTGR